MSHLDWFWFTGTGRILHQRAARTAPPPFHMRGVPGADPLLPRVGYGGCHPTAATDAASATVAVTARLLDELLTQGDNRSSIDLGRLRPIGAGAGRRLGRIAQASRSSQRSDPRIGPRNVGVPAKTALSQPVDFFCIKPISPN